MNPDGPVASPPGQELTALTEATADRTASQVLRLIPSLGLSANDQRVVTGHAEALLDAALGDPESFRAVRARALRLAGVLRSTGNPRARALAAAVDPPI